MYEISKTRGVDTSADFGTRFAMMIIAIKRDMENIDGTFFKSMTMKILPAIEKLIQRIKIQPKTT